MTVMIMMTMMTSKKQDWMEDWPIIYKLQRSFGVEMILEGQKVTNGNNINE
jgi:hypothetical protein